MNRKRLEQVLRIREIQERGARGEMARTTQRHRRARTVERRTWDQLDAWPVDAGSLVALQSVRDAGMLAADTQHIVTVHAAEQEAGARAEWTVAARRVEALERLAERLREAESEEAERLQNNEIDDMVLARRGRETR